MFRFIRLWRAGKPGTLNLEPISSGICHIQGRRYCWKKIDCQFYPLTVLMIIAGAVLDTGGCQGIMLRARRVVWLIMGSGMDRMLSW